MISSLGSCFEYWVIKSNSLWEKGNRANQGSDDTCGKDERWPLCGSLTSSFLYIAMECTPWKFHAETEDSVKLYNPTEC